VDVSARLRAEVRPVLEAIAEMQRRADGIRSAANAKGASLVDAAEREAADTIRKAEAEAPAARTAAADAQWHAVEGEVRSALQAAKAEASRIDAVSVQRLPDVVERVSRCVLSGQGLS
jgi:vacuolar-type H+-ATPase subunit H